MNIYEEFSLEFLEMEGIIQKYTGEPSTNCYLIAINKALEENNIEKIIFSLKKLSEWYTKNIIEIGLNQFVKNLDSHKKNKNRIEYYISKLADYTPTKSPETCKSSDIKPEKSKIFISHASPDYLIGEALVDFLVKIGIKSDQLFFTSNYHTGVPLGHDFHETIREELQNSSLAIFLISEDFYNSPFCMNEMGAIWISNKKFVPFIIDDTPVKDLKGFIDARNIALTLEVDRIKDLITCVGESFETAVSVDEVGILCDDLCNVIKNEISKKPKFKKDTELSSVDTIILDGRLTEDELLLLSYFIEYQTNRFLYPLDNNDIEFQEWIKSVKINIEKATRLLLESSLIQTIDEDQDPYWVEPITIGYKIDMIFFRKLLDLGSDAKAKIDKVLEKRKSSNHIDNKTSELSQKEIDIEDQIINGKLTEHELLLLKYIIDTGSYILGDRWMAEHEINTIRKWEDENNLYDTLSNKYQETLRKFVIRNFVIEHSFTSYRNPREYRLVDSIKDNILNLSKKSQEIISKSFNCHKFPSEDEYKRILEEESNEENENGN